MVDQKKQNAPQTGLQDLDPQNLKRKLLALKNSSEQQINELKEAHDEELRALRDQLIQLKNHLKIAQSKLTKLEQSPPINVENEELDKLKKHNEQLERVILHLRERTEEAKLETKTLRDELETCYQQQNIITNLPVHEAQQQLQTTPLLQDYYDQAIAENNQLTAKLEEALDGRIAAETRLEQMIKVQQEKEQAQLEESESRLRIAQQHLAKKVKEVAVLTEHHEELQRQYDELKSTLEVTKGRAYEMQGTIESLKEGIRSADSQSAKWEEKYFRLYDKYQEGEIRYRELKKVEEKFVQMQAMIANMGSFMGVHTPAVFMEKQDPSLPPSPYDFFGMPQDDTQDDRNEPE